MSALWGKDRIMKHITRVTELSMDVVTAAKDRIRNVFRTAPKVRMSFSGGKDSIVLSDIVYKMCLGMEIDRRKLVVDFIDEEAIFPCVETIVSEWRDKWQRIGVQFNWWCIQVKHFSCLNSLSSDETFICWDSTKRDVWVRPMPKGAITNHPLLKERQENYQSFLGKISKDSVSIIGVRTAESIQRRNNVATAIGLGGSSKKIFPIYDMNDKDVWYYIKQNNLNIPDAYLYMWQIGRPKNRLRISQFFSVDTIGTLSEMSQYYPDLYNRICEREPNAYMTMLYYDTELFRRAKKTKEDDNVDYKKKFFEYINSAAGIEQAKLRPKEFREARKQALDVYMNDADWKKLYNTVIGGDPKMRSYRAIAMCRGARKEQFCQNNTKL